MLFIEGFDQSNAEQMRALQCLEQMGQSLFLTGSAGTGKSYFLEHYCAMTQKEFVKLAPTGLAALNIHGQTIHKFFRLPRHTLTDLNSVQSITRRYRKNVREMMRHLELLIIDEISMVRCDILDAIDKILQVVRHSSHPFGGVQLLMVGDPFQLPPVVTADEREALQYAYPTSTDFYFFEAHSFQALRPHAIALRKIYRQESQTFASALEEIRMGAISETTIQLLNSRVSANWESELMQSEEHSVVLFSHRKSVDEYNVHRCNEIKTPEVIFRGVLQGKLKPDILPVALEMSLKVGMQVMLISNHPDGQWANGTTGVITHIKPAPIDAINSPEVIVETATGEHLLVTPHTWTEIEYEYDTTKEKIVERQVGSFTQLPLVVAYAITVHKAQGQTCDRLVVDPTRFFAKGQGYVALSRCRSLEGLTLTAPLRPWNLQTAPAVLDFYHQFITASPLHS